MGQYYHDVTTLAMKDGFPVRSTFPKEGGVNDSGSWVVSKASKALDQAHAFIDFMLRPDIAARNSNYVFYANGNKASQAEIEAEVIEDPAIYPPAETFANLFTTTPNDPRTQREVTRIWTAVKTGS
jgi:putrescine transport system substrate-binding protein